MSKVVFSREELTMDPDMWDDRELILAYDRAVASAEAELERKQRKNKNKVKKDWKMGDFCRAVYNEDALVYEATIQSIDHSKGKAVVRFVGYNNEDTARIVDLEESQGQKARDEQILQAEIDNEEEEEKEKEEKSEIEEVWSVGDYCTAKYDLDGLWYEAVIEAKEEEEEGKVRIKFLGYNNLQTVSVNDLHPSRGKENQETQVKSAKVVSKEPINFEHGFPDLLNTLNLEDPKESKKKKKKMSSFFEGMPLPPPPPPPNVVFSKDKIENEAFQSLLISWYQAGYNAGYLTGLQEGKKAVKKKT